MSALNCSRARQDWVRYYQSAVLVPGESTQRIAEAVREAQVYAALGIVEQDDYGSRGTLYWRRFDCHLALA